MFASSLNTSPCWLERDRRAGAEREGVDVGLRAREAAERVVGARLREVVEPGDEVGRVRPALGDDRRGVAERLGRLRERAALAAEVDRAGAEVDLTLLRVHGDVRERRVRPVQLEQVVARAGGAGQAREVADRRHGLVRERPQLVEVRAELARDGLRRLDERVDVVERGAQVHVRRVGRAHEVGKTPDELGERLLLRPERARGAVQVVDERAELALLLRERGDEPRRVDEEALEHRRVVRQLAEEAARRGEVGLEIGEAAVGVVADARVLAPPAAEEALDRLARLLVEDAEERVDLDDGRRAGRTG